MLRLSGVTVVALLAVVALVVAGCGGSSNKKANAPALNTGTVKANAPVLHPATLKAKAPAVYSVKFTTTKGPFVVTVHRAWAPLGADRFYNLVRAKFFDGVTFFRVVKAFVVQFGISPSPAVSKLWTDNVMKDDPVKKSNIIGTITYADAGPNTRATQVFINLGDNTSLDAQGFAPFGQVTSGMSVVNKLYGGYGEQPASGAAQDQLIHQGNAFLEKHFPKLDGIVTARLVSP